MRVALLADIHGNAIALDAVLRDLQTRPADHIVSLGDVAAMGPAPGACIERLQASGASVVMGNSDWALLHPPPDYGPDERYRRFGEIEAWCAAQLDPDHRQTLATYAATVRLALGPDTDLLAYHGSPRSFDEPVAATTPADVLDEYYAQTPAQIYAGAHTHQPFIRRHRQAVVLNPGSVGLAFEQDASGAKSNRPWAEYGLVEYADGQLRCELCRVPYEGRAVVEQAISAGMPYAEWWGRDLLR